VAVAAVSHGNGMAADAELAGADACRTSGKLCGAERAAAIHEGHRARGGSHSRRVGRHGSGERKGLAKHGSRIRGGDGRSRAVRVDSDGQRSGDGARGEATVAVVSYGSAVRAQAEPGKSQRRLAGVIDAYGVEVAVHLEGDGTGRRARARRLDGDRRGKHYRLANDSRGDGGT